MKILTTPLVCRAGRPAALLGPLLLLSACAIAPASPPGAAEVRGKLSALQDDSNLAPHVPLELGEAEIAVRIAEQPLRAAESELGEHRVFMADRKVAIARARATGRHAKDQRAVLVEERDQARLMARTREAERARADAGIARDDANRARTEASMAQDAAFAARHAESRAIADADTARRDAEEARISEAQGNADADRARRDAKEARRSEAQAIADVETERRAADVARRSEAKFMADADRARRDAEEARRLEAQASAEASDRAADLQRQIDRLEAKTTERGLVLTLGDLLFTTDSASLEPGAERNLNKLVEFLDRYPERHAQIEGHTDNVGSGGYNLQLSQRRAESVMDYLTRNGIAAERLSALGLGMERPVASNLSAAGRQQNRRVEIIIDDPD